MITLMGEEARETLEMSLAKLRQYGSQETENSRENQ
jgi:hypothetical protein